MKGTGARPAAPTPMARSPRVNRVPIKRVRKRGRKTGTFLITACSDLARGENAPAIPALVPEGDGKLPKNPTRAGRVHEPRLCRLLSARRLQAEAQVIVPPRLFQTFLVHQLPPRFSRGGQRLGRV